MMRSVAAVLLGMILALVIGCLVLVGIVAPVFTVFMGLEGAGMTPFVGLVIAVVVGIAFYFGGMLAGYRAPSRRRLHGILVAVIPLSFNSFTFAFFETADNPLNLSTAGDIVLTAALFAVSVVAAYVGAGRGERVYAHNQDVARKMEARERAKARRAAEARESSELSERSDAEG